MSQATRNQAPEFPAFLKSFLREANECEDCWLVAGDEVFFPLSEGEQNTNSLKVAKATVMDIQDAKDRGLTDEECEQLDEDDWYGVMLALEVEVAADAEGVEVKPRRDGGEGKMLTVKVQGRQCWGPLKGTKKGVHAGTVGYSVLEDDVYDLKLTRSPRFMDLWEHQQQLDVSEGVRWSDEAAPPALLTQLRESIDAFASSMPIDIHPGTHGIVRDLVHPSLYPFIRGVSPGDVNLQQGVDAKEDMWGRAYEDSVYQWLPSEFAVDTDGTCSIDSYINNLPRTEANEALYRHLATLFEAFLPMLEEVLQYGRSVQFMQGEMPFDDSTPTPPEKGAMPPLRGSKLQVVSKIAEYTLEPGQTFEGVWHVEGLPQEHIAATALCILDRSEQLEGGTLMFKRAFLEAEAQHIFYNVPQVRHSMVEDIISGGLLPLGSLPTDVPGRMIAFPNSHVHKVSKLLNAGSETARRRIVVFFVVNPDRRIVSTRDVPPQQDTMSLEDALEHRLTLMKERKYHKQDWNVREIELCEH